MNDIKESLLMIPSGIKEGKLYSFRPSDGSLDFTVSRNSTATYVAKDGLIKTALANVPRFDWGTGEAALLVQPQRTNLITYSEDFSNAEWTKSTINITPNSIISPDGTLNASKFTEGIGNIKHRLESPDLNIVNGNTYTYTIYAKKSEHRYLYLTTSNPNSNFECMGYFDLELGVAVSYIGVFKIELLSGGFYRCSVTGDANITATFEVYHYISSTEPQSNSYPVYEGDGVSGIYIYGSQFEQGSTASSYIPTNGTTVTRLADNISVPTPAGVTAITETIEGVEQTPITTIPATYSLPVGNINKVTML